MPGKIAMFLVFVACCGTANAQAPYGKVVFYRDFDSQTSDYEPAVFFDGIEMGRVANGKSIEVTASAGHHDCVADSIQDPSSGIDVTSGGTLYLRVQFTQTTLRHAFLVATTETQFREKKELPEIPNLSPVRTQSSLASVFAAPSNGFAPKNAGATSERANTANFGDLAVTATNLESRANYNSNITRVSVFLSFLHVGKDGSICAAFSPKIITTSGLEFVGTALGGMPIREMLPGERRTGSFAFEVKGDVQPLELLLELVEGTIRCEPPGEGASENEFIPKEIRLDVHDLPRPTSRGVFRAGVGGVSFPACAYHPDPHFSSEARAMKIEGSVMLEAEITEDGTPSNIQIVKGLGYGLDEEAAKALETWRCQQAIGPNGNPVTAIVTVEMNFRLVR